MAAKTIPMPSSVTPNVAPCEQEAGLDEHQVPLAPALQAVRLTVEEAEKIRRMLDDPKQPRHSGTKMPDGDPSDLLGQDKVTK